MQINPEEIKPLQGLDDKQVSHQMDKWGRNELPEMKTNQWFKFLGYFGGPIAYLIELATILSAVLGNWIDFTILVIVLFANAIIGFHEEAKAESALDALKNNLALKTKCFRNGNLVEIEAELLVPGDIIAIRLGDIVPADCRLLGIDVTGEPVGACIHVDQASLTGESLPVEKEEGDEAYASSTVKQGAMLAQVTKTGIHSFIGRAADLICHTKEEGHFQKVIKTIGDFLVIITVVMALIILLVNIFGKNQAFIDALKTTVIITIAAIPVGLPTVMSVTMAVGASQLAKKQVIVKRLTAIEELASVSVLCSDKTGTLTMNKLSFDKPFLANKGNTSLDFDGSGIKYSDEDLLLLSYLASEPGAHDPIEMAVRKAAESKVQCLKNRPEKGNQVPGYKVNQFIPFNPTSKYTEGKVTNLESNERFSVIKGAPQVVIRMCGGHQEAEDAVNSFARRGLRALGVARTVDEGMSRFEFVGLISLLDPPREDSEKTIKECEELGVNVKMITGDQQIIAVEVAQRLGMQRTILDASKLTDTTCSEEVLSDRVAKADGFAHVIPEHKYRVVELLQERGLLVGMTGDGVNDAPALKKANVGIAVEGCTDAARSASDIVLLAEGLSTIVDGIKSSRAIFQRMRSYALYRIASTIHFLLFFFISILVYDFTIPDRLILMIAVLNDAATLVIAVDNAKISKRPDKWRLGQLLSLSFILGFFLMMFSFGHFFYARSVFPFEAGDHSENHLIVQTIMYLQISSAPHFVIFSTRLGSWWWVSAPSWFFTLAIAGTQLIAGVITLTGPEFLEAAPIGWGWTLGVLGISLLIFMFLDVIKVLVFKYWSFELTAMLWPSASRRKKLQDREAREKLMKRVRKNFAKVRNGARVVNACNAFRTYDKSGKYYEDYPDNSDDLIIVKLNSESTLKE